MQVPVAAEQHTAVSQDQLTAVQAQPAGAPAQGSKHDRAPAGQSGALPLQATQLAGHPAEASTAQGNPAGALRLQSAGLNSKAALESGQQWHSQALTPSEQQIQHAMHPQLQQLNARQLQQPASQQVPVSIPAATRAGPEEAPLSPAGAAAAAAMSEMRLARPAAAAHLRQLLQQLAPQVMVTASNTDALQLPTSAGVAASAPPALAGMQLADLTSLGPAVALTNGANAGTGPSTARRAHGSMPCQHMQGYYQQLSAVQTLLSHRATLAAQVATAAQGSDVQLPAIGPLQASETAGAAQPMAGGLGMLSLLGNSNGGLHAASSGGQQLLLEGSMPDVDSTTIITTTTATHPALSVAAATDTAAAVPLDVFNSQQQPAAGGADGTSMALTIGVADGSQQLPGTDGDYIIGSGGNSANGAAADEVAAAAVWSAESNVRQPVLVSKYQGVEYLPAERRWQAYMLEQATNEVVWLDKYDSEFEAALAHDRELSTRVGEQTARSHLNFKPLAVSTAGFSTSLLSELHDSTATLQPPPQSQLLLQRQLQQLQSLLTTQRPPQPVLQLAAPRPLTITPLSAAAPAPTSVGAAAAFAAGVAAGLTGNEPAASNTVLVDQLAAAAAWAAQHEASARAPAPVSKYRGVEYLPAERKWQAYMLDQAIDQVVWLDKYDSELEAALAHDRELFQRMGLEAAQPHLNFNGNGSTAGSVPEARVAGTSSIRRGASGANANEASLGRGPQACLQSANGTIGALLGAVVQPSGRHLAESEPSAAPVQQQHASLLMQIAQAAATSAPQLAGSLQNPAYKGVMWDPLMQRYRAQAVDQSGNAMLLGAFETAEGAAAEYDTRLILSGCHNEQQLNFGLANYAHVLAHSSGAEQVITGVSSSGRGFAGGNAVNDNAAGGGGDGGGRGQGRGRGGGSRGAAVRTSDSKHVSQYKGVSWSASCSRWVAVIWDRVKKKARHVGVYDSQEEAARAYDKEVLMTQGAKNTGLNFRDSVQLFQDEVGTRLDQAGGGGGTTKANSSSYRGVSWHERSRRWETRAWCQGRQHFVGTFTSEEAAARAYDRAILKLGGPGAKSTSRLNFPITDYDLAEIEAMELTQLDSDRPPAKRSRGASQAGIAGGAAAASTGVQDGIPAGDTGLGSLLAAQPQQPFIQQLQPQLNTLYQLPQLLQQPQLAGPSLFVVTTGPIGALQGRAGVSGPTQQDALLLTALLEGDFNAKDELKL